LLCKANARRFEAVEAAIAATLTTLAPVQCPNLLVKAGYAST